MTRRLIIAIVSALTILTAFPDLASAAEPKVVYLTFDDGPSRDEASQNVLDVLDRFNVKATFFVVGDAIEADVASFQKMQNQGHAFGNHTDTHPRLTDLTEAQIAKEFDDAQAAVRNAGGPPLTCFRPPYGASNDTVRRVSAQRGLSEIFWQADGTDYLRPLPTIEEIIENLDRTIDGDTIILHDGVLGQDNTAPALEQWLSQNGSEYEFRPIPDCLPNSRPAAPSNCIAKLVDGNAVVSWTPSRNDNAASYRIRRDQNSSNTEIIVGSVGPDVTTWTDTAAHSASNAYQVEIVTPDGSTALRTCGPVGGLVLGAAAVMMPNAAPSMCTATADGSAINVTWPSVAGVATYLVSRTADGNGPNWRGAVSAPDTTFSDTNRNVTLDYYVASKFADGSTSSQTLCRFVADTPPNLANCDVMIGNGQATVTWDPAEGATHYVIYRTVDASQQHWRGRVDARTHTFTDITRPGEIEYYVTTQAGTEPTLCIPQR